jgi:phosphoribosylamine--glycine ligase
MKVFVLGSGAREHAIAWKLSQSPKVERVFVGPGNAGTDAFAKNYPSADVADFPAVIEAVRESGADAVFVGPDNPLAEGVVDFLQAGGFFTVGPTKSQARLESSKAFSKAFMKSHDIPTARAEDFRDFAAFERRVKGWGGKRFVIKKSGLAAGKGVLETSDAEEALDFGRAILASDSVLVEEHLTGWEVSIFGVSDGESYIVLPPCTDFKKAHDGDTGPNTGGMGSICPVPWVDDALMHRIVEEAVKPTYSAMAKDGLSYCGVLYFGLMITAEGPKVLEYNVRFGDPETQALLPLTDLDFGELMDALKNRTLASKFAGAPCAAAGSRAVSGMPFVLRAGSSALGVVVAGAGYPAASPKGRPVELPAVGKDGVLESGTMIFHATTSRDAQGRVLTGGGRSFTVVGTGKSLAAAGKAAYAATRDVRFEGAWYRADIGAKFMGGKA